MYRRGLYKSLVNECCNHFKTRGECLDLYKHELRVHSCTLDGQKVPLASIPVFPRKSGCENSTVFFILTHPISY